MDYTIKTLLTREEVEKRIKELAKEIEKDYCGKDLLVIGLLKGSIMFMSDLIKEMDLPVMIDFMSVSSYSGTTSTGVINVLKDKDFDVIAGTATAGIPWASFIAYELNKPLCYIRAEKKEHGRGKQIEGAECNGKKLILIEDLISTGGSSIKAFEAAKAEGAIGLEIISIFTYEFEKAYKNFEEAGIKFSSLSNFSSLMEIAKDEKYITEEELSKALEWNKNPDAWGK